jgi:hypothetical protein
LLIILKTILFINFSQKSRKAEEQKSRKAEKQKSRRAEEDLIIYCLYGDYYFYRDSVYFKILIYSP